MASKVKGLSIVLMLSVLSIAVLAIYKTVNASPSFSKEEAISIVQSQYEGEIKEAKLLDQDYIVTLVSSTGSYDITVPKNGGGISHITRLEVNTPESNIVSTLQSNNGQEQVVETEIGVNPQQSSETNAETTEESTMKPVSTATATPQTTSKPTSQATPGAAATAKPAASIISVEAAGKLALKQVSGEIDDVELKSHGDQRYYLVEIEASNNQDAIVQIHALTGKVMSISWESNDDDDDDREDREE